MRWLEQLWRLMTWRPHHLGHCPRCGTYWYEGADDEFVDETDGETL